MQHKYSDNIFIGIILLIWLFFEAIVLGIWLCIRIVFSSIYNNQFDDLFYVSLSLLIGISLYILMITVFINSLIKIYYNFF